MPWIFTVWLAVTTHLALAQQQAAVICIAEDFDATWKEARWQFSDGNDFPAPQSFTSADSGSRRPVGGLLQFDFRGGGNYVGAYLQLTDAPEVAALRLWIKKPPGNTLTVRYTDQTDQTLQKSVWAPGGRWVQVLVPFDAWTGHWGGADDGQIHGPPKRSQYSWNVEPKSPVTCCWTTCNSRRANREVTDLRQ